MPQPIDLTKYVRGGNYRPSFELFAELYAGTLKQAISKFGLEYRLLRGQELAFVLGLAMRHPKDNVLFGEIAERLLNGGATFLSGSHTGKYNVEKEDVWFGKYLSTTTEFPLVYTFLKQHAVRPANIAEDFVVDILYNPNSKESKFEIRPKLDVLTNSSHGKRVVYRTPVDEPDTVVKHGIFSIQTSLNELNISTLTDPNLSGIVLGAYCPNLPPRTVRTWLRP